MMIFDDIFRYDILGISVHRANGIALTCIDSWVNIHELKNGVEGEGRE